MWSFPPADAIRRSKEEEEQGLLMESPPSNGGEIKIERRYRYDDWAQQSFEDDKWTIGLAVICLGGAILLGLVWFSEKSKQIFNFFKELNKKEAESFTVALLLVAFVLAAVIVALKWIFFS